MGVLGLLPLLQATSRRANLSDFRGKRVGVDAYCWLYRGASSCAKQLALGEPANGHIRFCLKQLGRLVSVYGLDVVLVFDGRPLPAKEFQSLRRRLKRKECLDRAMGLQANGCNADGVFAQAVEITPEGMSFRYSQCLLSSSTVYCHIYIYITRRESVTLDDTLVSPVDYRCTCPSS